MAQGKVGRMKRIIMKTDHTAGGSASTGLLSIGVGWQRQRTQGSEGAWEHRVFAPMRREFDVLSFAHQIAFPASEARLLPVTYDLLR